MERDPTANRLIAKLATRWLDRRVWLPTDFQVLVANSSLCTAQAIARDLIAAAATATSRKYAATLQESFPNRRLIPHPQGNLRSRLPTLPQRPHGIVSSRAVRTSHPTPPSITHTATGSTHMPHTNQPPTTPCLRRPLTPILRPVATRPVHRTSHDSEKTGPLHPK